MQKWLIPASDLWDMVTGHKRLWWLCPPCYKLGDLKGKSTQKLSLVPKRFACQESRFQDIGLSRCKVSPVTLSLFFSSYGVVSLLSVERDHVCREPGSAWNQIYSQKMKFHKLQIAPWFSCFDCLSPLQAYDISWVWVLVEKIEFSQGSVWWCVVPINSHG